MGKATLSVVAEIPDDMIGEFIQYIRDFDTAHPDCHMQILCKADEKTVAEMDAIFDTIRPPFNIREKHRKQ